MDFLIVRYKLAIFVLVYIKYWYY